MPRVASFASCLSAIFLSTYSFEVFAQENYGTFQFPLIVKALADGRKLQLTHPFSFMDPTNKLWAVPTGTVVDGASIPTPFLSIIGGPFADKYREASVIHDHYCDTKAEPWEAVHRVFYNGMRARGVGSVKAKLMYAAVYSFGPRWIESSPAEKAPLISGQPVLLESAKEAIMKYISESDPSLADIESLSRQLAEVQNLGQLEKILYENANCTPILFQAGGLVEDTVKRTLVLCGLSKLSKKQAALRNVRILIAQLRALLQEQRDQFLPLIILYTREPTPANWQRIQNRATAVLGLIKLAMRPAVDLADAGDKELEKQADRVFGLLAQRSVMISKIQGPAPQSSEGLLEWRRTYMELVRRLEAELRGLEPVLQ